MQFAKWLDTLIDEKGYDIEEDFEVEGSEWGTNYIPLSVVLEAIKQTSQTEQEAIKKNLVTIDFVNGSCLDYFRYLAQALAM